MSSFTRRQAKYVKKPYRVRNWAEYEAGLRNRGSLASDSGTRDLVTADGVRSRHLSRLKPKNLIMVTLTLNDKKKPGEEIRVCLAGSPLKVVGFKD